MAFTTPRMTPGLRLTPKASPYFNKSPSVRSPVKPSRDEQCLSLKQIIGTTTTSSNAFDSLPDARSFAYCAGAAAVVSTIDQDLNVTQRFYRAKPTSGPVNPSTPLYDSPLPPFGALQGPRSRSFATPKDASNGVMSFGSSTNDLDSPGGRNNLSRERAKATTCLSLSPDGKLIAVGESGYRPRVLIFSTARDAPSDLPLTALSDHTFGVRCLAFSPDSQHLASLGDVNDGFLYVWSVNQKTGTARLHGSNRCISNIRQIVWLGDNLVTIGTRHVKVWRVDKPNARTSPTKRMSDGASAFANATRTLSGRNCLLGALLDKTFTAMVAFTTDKALVCSDQGDICLMVDNESSPLFHKVAECGFAVTAITLHSGKNVLVGGDGGLLMHFDIDELLAIVPSVLTTLPSEKNCFRSVPQAAHIVSMVPLGSDIIVLDSFHGMQLVRPFANDQDSLASSSVTKRLLAHGAAVLGVQAAPCPTSFDFSFFTFSADGVVLFWDYAGASVKDLQIPLEQVNSLNDDLINELKVVKSLKDCKTLITGDKLGVMRAIEITTGRALFDVKAHAGEITDIATYERDNYTSIASTGRDRMVQLFQRRGDDCQLVQTLDEHAGAVTGVLFSPDASKLVTCSIDRSIVIRDAIVGEIQGQATSAYTISRTITLKATPLSISMTDEIAGPLIVSTVDKQVQKYTLDSVNLASSFRASDHDDGDLVALTAVTKVQLTRQTSAIAGISNTDKSIRVYDDSGRLIGREYGHTEGMTGLAVIQDPTHPEKRSLVTAATDGTIFIWAISSLADQLQDMLESLDLSPGTPGTPGTPKANAVFASRPPLRRVLSTSELMQIQGVREEDDPKLIPIKRARSRSPRRKPSKISLRQVPEHEPAPPIVLSSRKTNVSEDSTAGTDTSKDRRKSRTRPSSPTMPRIQAQTVKESRRQSSIAPTLTRRKSMGSTVTEYNGITASTDQMCRNLQSFRKRLLNTSDVLSVESVRELERELSTTAKALADKAARNETVMVKLLDHYSERLVDMLDEKIAASVAKQVSQSREAMSPSTGLLGEPEKSP